MTTEALRYNQGKLRYSLISQQALEGLMETLEYGANKYALDNWKKGLNYKSVIDSMMRHVNAMLRGEVEDPESGILHIDHVQANAMFLSHFIRSCSYEQFNDL